MWRLIATRLAAFVPTVLATSLVLFVTVNVVPGSAAKAALGIDATAQAIARFEHEQGLDRPLHVQYLDWLGKAVRGDFGTSFQNHLPVGPELVSRLPVTLELAILAFLIANAIAVPLGALAAYHHQQRLDSVISVFATVLGAAPNVVIWRHALQNALITFLTVGAVEFGWLFGGVVIIEDIFLLPGVGQLVLVGIINRDYPVLLASALTVTVVVLAANMVVDLVAAVLDPRQVHARSRA